MRQLIIQVPRGQGKEVFDIAKSLDGRNLAQFEAMGSEGLIDRYFCHARKRQHD
ncbi:MAG: hypothetical protein ICV78_09045 [Tolypothrix sp. Co-bin9]|nr:hypothetical protein [Tolypothrix sp. Co-bin9]